MEMKPIILKTPEGLYVCEIPIENEPEDGASDSDAMALECPDCDDTWFCWEEQDWSENKLFYENDLEHLEELPQKEKM